MRKLVEISLQGIKSDARVSFSPFVGLRAYLDPLRGGFPLLLKHTMPVLIARGEKEEHEGGRPAESRQKTQENGRDGSKHILSLSLQYTCP